MVKTTAVATLYTKSASQDGQTALSFMADYTDARNKEWAMWTPSLSLNMTVIDSVAEQFVQGQTYLLTIQPK
jgi:hypothetical protein